MSEAVPRPRRRGVGGPHRWNEMRLGLPHSSYSDDKHHCHIFLTATICTIATFFYSDHLTNRTRQSDTCTHSPITAAYDALVQRWVRIASGLQIFANFLKSKCLGKVAVDRDLPHGVAVEPILLDGVPPQLPPCVLGLWGGEVVIRAGDERRDVFSILDAVDLPQVPEDVLDASSAPADQVKQLVQLHPDLASEVRGLRAD